MGLDIQKAGVWKRIAAWMLDCILFIILAVGFVALLAEIVGYNKPIEELNAAYEKYESKYEISFGITQDEYSAMTQEEIDRYNQAYDAITSDSSAMKAYNLIINLTLVILTGSLLLTYLLLEFLIPILFGNGQSVGKKVFGIGLIRVDCVKVSNIQLLVRTLIGKFTVETMVPVYIILMLFFGTTGMLGLIIIAGLLLTQTIIFLVTRNHLTIHDYFAGTVAVDIQSQKVFNTSDELLEYKKKLHSEEVARKDY